MQILIVDDEPTLRNSFSAFFQRKGFETKTAENGKIALDIVQANPIDFVISDIRMPEMDGVNFLDAMKKIKPKIPLVFVTAFADITREQAIEKGALEVFTKPIDRKTLFEFIKNNLNGAPILFVDDETSIREHSAKNLRKANYNVVTAKNAKSALEIIKNSNLTALMVDIELPDMNGIVVASQFRKKNKDAPICLISGALNLDEDQEKILESVNADFIGKPITKTALLDWLKKQKL